MPNGHITPKNLGFYKATENTGGYFIITLPKEVVKKLKVRQGDTFSVDFVESMGMLIYTRKDPGK